MPPIWKTKPQNSNLISPKDAMTTPRTIIETLPSTLRLGGAMPNAHVARRTATAVVAWTPCQSKVFFPNSSASTDRGRRRTLSIWIKDTLNVRYAKFPEMSVKLNMTPIGTMARLDKSPHQQVFHLFLRDTTHIYVCVVIGTLWRESRVLVKRAMYWVMMVPKTWCHVVRKRAAVEIQCQQSRVSYRVLSFE